MTKWRWLEQITDHEQLLRLKVLENVPLFAGLTRRQLGKLLVKFFEKEYRLGETIFTEGEPGKALFIVLTGRVLICRALHEGEEILATLSAGSYFGELRAHRRSAALCQRPCCRTIAACSYYTGVILRILWRVKGHLQFK